MSQKFMTINGKSALSEDIVNNQYVIIFPEDTNINPPFEVRTGSGDLVHTVDDFTVFLFKETMADGKTTKMFFGRADITPAELDRQRGHFIMRTHQILANALQTPMSFNGGRFSVTLEKQNLLSAQLGISAIATEAGVPFKLEWNEAGQECVEWQFEELFALSLAMAAYVRPLVAAQRHVEVQINEAQTIAEIGGHIVDFTQFLDMSIS